MNMFYIRQPMNTGVISNYHYSQNLYQVTNIYTVHVLHQAINEHRNDIK